MNKPLKHLLHGLHLTTQANKKLTQKGKQLTEKTRRLGPVAQFAQSARSFKGKGTKRSGRSE